MSRWLKVTIVLAVGAFLVGFRVHTSTDSAEPAQAAAPVNAKRTSADVVRKPSSKVRLADVAALPELRGEAQSVIEARAKQAAAAKAAKAKAKAAAERRAKAKAKARAERRKKAAERRKRERAADRRRAAARKKAAAQAPAAPRVVATPVPTPVYRPPVYTPPAPKKKSYVGKDFDSKG